VIWNSRSSSITMDTYSQMRLRWRTHQGTILSVCDALLATESLLDVTLAAEGQYIRAHKLILSACSPYFQVNQLSDPFQDYHVSITRNWLLISLSFSLWIVSGVAEC